MKRAARLLGVAISLLAVHAGAEPSSDLERAKESFKAGATAYAAGDYLAAIQALDAAYQLTPLPAIAFSLGQAERRQYFVDHVRVHLDRAIELFRHYLEVSPNGSRRADALDALSQLEPLAVSRLLPNAPTRAADQVAERRTRLLIGSDAPGASVVLDQAPAVGSPLIREVEPGKHHVRVEAPGFFPAERDVIAVSGELMPSQVPLRERPSTLSIWTPAAAEIYIDGVFVSPGGDGVTLQLPSGKHHLAVARNGYRVAAQELDLPRGSARKLRVLLEPTAQRLVSEGMFIAGGAALGASLVFSSFAIRSEGRAEDFLGQREHRNVSTAEVYAYQAAIIDRDRYRLGTTVCLAASAGFFITALFLHELDRPNPQQLYRRSPRTSLPLAPPAKRNSTLRLHLSPLLSDASLGGVIGGSF